MNIRRDTDTARPMIPFRCIKPSTYVISRAPPPFEKLRTRKECYGSRAEPYFDLRDQHVATYA